MPEKYFIFSKNYDILKRTNVRYIKEGITIARCDFSQIYKVLDRYMSRGYGNSQVEKVIAMYHGCLYAWGSLDYGQVSRWINGKQALTPAIAEYYKELENLLRLPDDIRQHLFPMLVDKKTAADELYGLVMQDDSLSVEKREELARRYHVDDEGAVEYFLADLLYFAACRPFLSPKGTAARLADGALSPDVRERIRGGEVPLPVRHFCGRTQDLDELHEILLKEKKVFLHGIAGIGKSELSRRYAKVYRKDYTNILYLTYSGDLKKDILGMTFTDDIIGEDEGRRFEKHHRYLKSLKGDTLLIVDNFDTTEEEEPFLPEIMEYPCRILFTSRYLWEDYASVELTEMEGDSGLMDLIMNLYPEGALDPAAMEQLASYVHRHTLSVELSARLLARGRLTVDELLEELEQTPVSPDTSDQIRIRKDGTARKETYREHIRLLFGLFGLDQSKRGCMGNLSMMPAKGIRKKRFADLTGLKDMNTVNDLVEMGLVHEDLGGQVMLHPLVRELVYQEIQPDDAMCGDLCDNIRKTCLRFGEDILWHRELNEILSNLMGHMEKERWDMYLKFLQDVYSHAEKYNDQAGKQRILSEMKTALRENPSRTKEDAAMYYDYLAENCKDAGESLRLSKKAAEVLPRDTENERLKININQNLFVRYLGNGQVKEALEQCGRVKALYDIHPDYREHDWLVFQINQGILLTALRQYVPALRVFEECRQYMADGGMEGTQDYADVIDHLAYVHYLIGDRGYAEEAFGESCRIYDALYMEDNAVAKEHRDQIELFKVMTDGQRKMDGYSKGLQKQ